MSPLQRCPRPASHTEGLLIGRPLFLVHCVELMVFGAVGRVGSSHSFPRAQLNGNRKIKGQKRRRKVPAMLMCQLRN